MKMNFFRALAVAIFAHAVLASASAQSLQKLPGSWFASEDKFGLLFEKSDGELYFAFGRCDRTGAHAQARLDLDIDPKIFGDAISSGKYIVVRWRNDGSEDLIVDKLMLNESGSVSLWSLSLAADLKTIGLWGEAQHLELTIGVRGTDGRGYVARQGYLLPDENRKKGLASFVRSCAQAH
jgi:hypothetical protein